MAAILRPIAGGAEAIALHEGENVLGRGSGGLLNLRLSRRHVAVVVTQEGTATIRCLGNNGCEICLRDETKIAMRPTTPPATIHVGDVINLLPGELSFRLEESEAAELEHSPKRQRLQDAAVSGEAAAAAPADSTGLAAFGVAALPPFAQPPKPAFPEGLGALEAIALAPDAAGGKVFLTTPEFVVAYDAYRKAEVHLLVLPRVRLGGPADLRREHAPMLRRMAGLGRAIADALRAREPRLAPCRLGFHAVPSMRQLHLHVISADLRSDALKNKKHWNSFTTDFFVPPEAWDAALEAHGRLQIDGPLEEAKLKQDMRCPLTGRPLKNMPDVKTYVDGAAWREKCMRCSY